MTTWGRGRHVLRDPGRRLALRRHESVPKRARGAREHEGLYARRHGGFKQIQSAADIRVDEVLASVGGDMRLMECGCVQNHIDASRAFVDKCAVGNRPHAMRKR
jgi:hypothetical protein